MLESKKFSGTTRYDRDDVVVWNREHLELQAKFAFDFAVRWGMVAAMPDGEDSAGRQQLRLATTDELVSRSVECAEKLFDEFRRREWIHQTPSLEEVS
jgi:hypothetical protein